MAGVRVSRVERKDHTPRLLQWLTVSLGVLVAMIVLTVNSNPTITGHAVFSGTYGQASTYIITVLTMVVIYLYFRFTKD